MPSLAADVTLAWDAKTEYGLAGYKLYYGTGSRTYSTTINVGNQTTSTVTGLGPGTYFFAVTAYYISGSETTYSNEVSTTISSSDTTPPGDVQNFTAVPGNGQVSLSWVNPADTDLKGVMIRYRADGVFPANKNDGLLVIDLTETPSTSDSFVHTGLTNGMTYYYSAFTYDMTLNYSSTAHVQSTPLANVTILSINPDRGNTAISVMISGTGFGTQQGSSTVTFNGVAAAVSSWSSTSITTTVPADASSGPVIATVNGVQSNGMTFKVGGKLAAPGHLRGK
jgi:hypothetical protein